MPETIQITFHVTPEQHAAMQELQDLTNSNRSALLRDLLRRSCELSGIRWPDNMQGRGKYDRGIMQANGQK